MKIRGVIVLLAVLLSILSPLSVNISLSGDTTYIVTLNVCGTEGSAVSSVSDMPAIKECAWEAIPIEVSGPVEFSSLHKDTNIVFIEMDRPPRV